MDQAVQQALVPYVLTFGRNSNHLNLDLDLNQEVVVLKIEDDETAGFAHLLNRANNLAFGGPYSMGMPLWVMLDCAIMPSAIIGFMLKADDAPDELWELLDVADDYDGWVPVSEYCASLTVEPGCVSGFSLHSHIVNQGIATRTKALALAVLNAKAQIGVTQFNNAAIRVHARFGPMEVLIHRPSIHTHSDETFVYRLQLPDLQALQKMARKVAEFGDRRRPEGVTWTFDPADECAHARLRSHLDDGGRAWIVPPGWRGTAEGCEIDMILGER